MIQDAQFTAEDRETIYRVIAMPLLQAAHSAPSLGLMQPWRFICVKNASLRDGIAALVDEERGHTAQVLAEREAEFLRLKIEGVRECAELIPVVLAPDDGTVFGRRTMPREMALCSAACAIENLWLAARAENLGVGRVSLFDPARLAQLLGCPEGAQPIALLCIGPVEQFYERPMLEQLDWRQGRPLQVMQDRWSPAC